MGQLSAAHVHDVIHTATTGDNRAVIEGHPGMAWLLPSLDAERDTLARLLGKLSDDSGFKQAMADASAADDAHDDAHRHLDALMTAGRWRGDAADRAAIARAHALLFPSGLRHITASYRSEVAATTVFANKLTQPEVASGLDALRAWTPAIDAATEACVATGRALGETLVRVEALEAKATAHATASELFSARNSAMKAWTTFVSAAEFALRGDDPATVEARERLLGRWRHLLAEVRTTPAPPPPVPTGGPPVDLA